MRTAQPILFESQYLPPVQYFTKWLLTDDIRIEAQENYRKGSYRNRCYIAGGNGVLRLSVPLVKGKNEQLPIRDVAIAYTEPWHRQHRQSIRSAYGNAPFFAFYAAEIEAVWEQNHKWLFDLNWEFLQVITRLLQLENTYCPSQRYREPGNSDVHDLRNVIAPRAKMADPHFTPTPYPQVFTERHGFLPNLSILDLLFCTGPQAILYLENSVIV